MNDNLKQYKDLAKRTRKKQQRCPHPGCPENDEPYFDPWETAQCTLNKPLLMVIPPGGIHLPCPVHPEGHHIHGPAITWCEEPMRREDNLPNRDNEPYCTGTGFTGNDTFKFSM